MNQPPDFSNTTEALKVPPNSIEAEQSVLGGLMLDNEAWDAVGDMVTDSDFYRRDHRLIFQTISKMMELGLSCDAITIAERLDKSGELDDAGGVTYLGELVSAIPSVANIKAYAEIVRERAVSRNLIKVANEIADSAFMPDGQTVEQLLDTAEKKVFELAEHGTRHRAGFEPMKALLTKAIDRIEAVFASDSVITGVTTGMDRFDEETSGLQNSDLIIVAGRPSMGKTSFAMNIAENSAIKVGCPVAVFSLEMPGDQLAMRMISSFGRINLKDLRTGNLTDEDWPKITMATGMLSEAPIYVDYTPGLTPTELRAKARRLKRESGLGMIIIDYLQLMESGSGGQGDNRATELS
ncbi:MAG: replicative DNA helicase, partial [Chromatiales bacterium]|nr:replicative DNA helicase [Chromatiales bacterium]